MPKKAMTPQTSRTTKDRVAEALALGRKPSRVTILSQHPEIREFMRGLVAARREGTVIPAYPAIAAYVNKEWGLKVSRGTVGNWFLELEAEDE